MAHRALAVSGDPGKQAIGGKTWDFRPKKLVAPSA